MVEYPHKTAARAQAYLGALVAVFLLLVGFGAIFALAVTPTASGQSLFDALDQNRVFYSLKSASLQAFMSSVFSILLAIPASLAVARRPHWFGMQFLVLLISLAMVLPTTVAALGLLSVWGRNGFLGSFLTDLYNFNIYGLHGVIIAHMMLNVPLVMRVMIPVLNAVHQSKWKLCALLSMTSWQRFIHVEWYAIKGVIPGLGSLIFLLCFTSFALVLILGGGPKVTTLEVEIYSAVRFEFNLMAAAGLSLIQFFCTAIIVILMSSSFLGKGGVSNGSALSVTDLRTMTTSLPRFDLGSIDKVLDVLSLFIVVLLVALPVAMVAVKGINPDLFVLLQRPQFIDALKASFSVAITSALFVTILAFVMATAKANLSIKGRYADHKAASLLRVLLDQGVMLYLVIPSVVLGSAAFIVLRGLGDIFGYAFSVVVIANTLLALPFAFRLLERRLISVLMLHDRLAAQLGISGWSRLKILTLPALRHDLSLVAGLSAALSIGDLGVIALFANADFRTLPWLLYQLSGKYAADEANALAFVLMLVTILFFTLSRVLIRKLLGGRYA